MRRAIVLVGVIAALAVAIPVVGTSATLSNGHRQNCKGSGELWHFVNNQTGGAAGGYLKVTFYDEDAEQEFMVTEWADAKNQATIHWNIYTTGDVTLVNAVSGTSAGSSNIPGRLVLSDFCKKG